MDRVQVVLSAQSSAGPRWAALLAVCLHLSVLALLVLGDGSRAGGQSQPPMLVELVPPTPDPDPEPTSPAQPMTGPAKPGPAMAKPKPSLQPPQPVRPRPSAVPSRAIASSAPSLPTSPAPTDGGITDDPAASPGIDSYVDQDQLGTREDLGSRRQGANRAGFQAEMAAFSQTVWSRIMARRPKQAAQTGLVHVRFTLATDGRVLDVAAFPPSGNPALDNLATDMIRQAAPFPRPPDGARADQLTFAIPINFRPD